MTALARRRVCCWDDRIASAFEEGTASRDVAALIKEVRGALDISAIAANGAKERALDPALSSKQVAEARRRMDDETFRHQRLEAALEKLRARLEQVRAEEEDQKRQVEYDEAQAERDELAVELAKAYPKIEGILAELLSRLAANDQRIEHINARALPRGRRRLLFAELIARGLDGFAEQGSRVPRVVTGVRLPAFKYNQSHPYAWPRSR